jgi:DNA helicase-2/ATP-dependent DNA helicase PcrA
LAEERLNPHELLALTFSNKAAREMRERVALEVSFDIGALNITTFHSFCARLLRSEATYLGLSRNFTIYDDSEMLSLIKSVMGKRGLNTKEMPPQMVKYYIADLKNQGYYFGSSKLKETYGRDKLDFTDDELYPIFLDYEAELARSNAVDFGGLIVGVIKLFESFPEVLDRYHKRFKYLLVDEYQDTNRAQFILLNL